MKKNALKTESGKLELTTETLRNLRLKSGLKTGPFQATPGCPTGPTNI